MSDFAKLHDIYDDAASPAHVDVTLTLFKNAIGGMTEEFEFGLFEPSGLLLATGKNDNEGLIQITHRFTMEGQFNYHLREIDGPQGWELDQNQYPVHIRVEQNPPYGFIVDVEYPQGVPGFKNIRDGEECSLIEFDDICFTHPGVFEYTIREITPSGGGWTPDGRIYRVIVHVVDDGFGNLVASFEYPDGFPEFVNTYHANRVCVVISARKRAIGAKLPCGRFEFGLYDETGRQVATARNE